MSQQAAQLRATVLAAGLGRRLEPLTRHLVPKPLFPLAGKTPIAEVWMRRLAAAGVSDLSANVCVLAESIRAHFARMPELDVRLVEESEPSGTLGGVCKQVLGREAKRTLGAAERIADVPPFRGSTVIAPSGDIVTEFGPAELEEMLDIHRRSGAAFSLIVNPVPPDRRKDFGTVVVPEPQSNPGLLSQFGRVSEFREKDPDSPSVLNNASIYMIERELIEELDPLRTATGAAEPFYDFGKHVFPAMLGKIPYARLRQRYPIVAIQYDGGWFDVGTKRDYLAVHRTILDGALDIPTPYKRTRFGAIGDEVEIDVDRVTLRPPVVIGNRCRIEDGAVLGPYAVIGDGWHVAAGARIEDSVLWERLPFHAEDRVYGVDERASVDAHRVGAVAVRGSIVAGGALEVDAIDQTVQVSADGRLELESIDWVPAGPRA